MMVNRLKKAIVLFFVLLFAFYCIGCANGKDDLSDLSNDEIKSEASDKTEASEDNGLEIIQEDNIVSETDKQDGTDFEDLFSSSSEEKLNSQQNNQSGKQDNSQSDSSTNDEQQTGNDSSQDTSSDQDGDVSTQDALSVNEDNESGFIGLVPLN